MEEKTAWVTDLDSIYDVIDRMMRHGEFEELAAVLSRIVVSDLPTNLLLGILTASLPARNLPSRIRIFQDAEKFLSKELLSGLE